MSWVVGRMSWVVGKKSWVVGKSRGSWVKSRGSWVKSRGSWVKKSWVVGKKSWVPNKKSWVPNKKSWVPRKSLGFGAKCFRIVTFFLLECVFFFVRLSQMYVERIKDLRVVDIDRSVFFNRQLGNNAIH
jgi:hypothetical protein